MKKSVLTMFAAALILGCSIDQDPILLGADGKDGVSVLPGEPVPTENGVLFWMFTDSNPNGFFDVGEDVVSFEVLNGKDGKDGKDAEPLNTSIVSTEEGSMVLIYSGETLINSFFVANGVDGIDGVDGTDGTNGTDGADGIDGVDGTNGLSPYELAINNGFEGSETDWLDSLIGASGEQGIQGIQGIQGPKGKDGKSIKVKTVKKDDCVYVYFYCDGSSTPFDSYTTCDGASGGGDTVTICHKKGNKYTTLTLTFPEYIYHIYEEHSGNSTQNDSFGNCNK